jgi:hypothetical protein
LLKDAVQRRPRLREQLWRRREEITAASIRVELGNAQGWRGELERWIICGLLVDYLCSEIICINNT